jgi:hypothetical protein
MTSNSTTVNNGSDNITVEEEPEEIIYEQVRDPSTFEVVIDPSTGKPLTQRVSSKDNPEYYQRLTSQLQQAEKVREEAKAAEERESKEPPTIMTRLMPHPKTGVINYWSFIVEKSTGREIILEGRDLGMDQESLKKQYSGKFHCPYCSKNLFSEQERSRHLNSHYAR